MCYFLWMYNNNNKNLQWPAENKKACWMANVAFHFKYSGVFNKNENNCGWLMAISSLWWIFTSSAFGAVGTLSRGAMWSHAGQVDLQFFFHQVDNFTYVIRYQTLISTNYPTGAPQFPDASYLMYLTSCPRQNKSQVILQKGTPTAPLPPPTPFKIISEFIVLYSD